MQQKSEKFFTERDKIFFKIFLLIFILCAVLINWSSVSWFLNIRTAPLLLKEKVEDIFSGSFIEENNESQIEDVEEEEADYCGENSITISAIDVTAPIVEAGGTTERQYRDALDRGVLHFPGSSYPGKEGLSVLLGHSAPEGWPKIKYDWVFTEIDALKEGDLVEICFNNNLYTYTVVDDREGRRIYEVGEDIPSMYEGKEEIVLMSCWPPGESESRIGIRGVIK